MLNQVKLSAIFSDGTKFDFTKTKQKQINQL